MKQKKNVNTDLLSLYIIHSNKHTHMSSHRCYCCCGEAYTYYKKERKPSICSQPVSRIEFKFSISFFFFGRIDRSNRTKANTNE